MSAHIRTTGVQNALVSPVWKTFLSCKTWSWYPWMLRDAGKSAQVCSFDFVSLTFLSRTVCFAVFVAWQNLHRNTREPYNWSQRNNTCNSNTFMCLMTMLGCTSRCKQLLIMLQLKRGKQCTLYIYCKKEDQLIEVWPWLIVMEPPVICLR